MTDVEGRMKLHCGSRDGERKVLVTTQLYNGGVWRENGGEAGGARCG